MILHFYTVTLRHDRGTVRIGTTAANALKAAQNVCAAEGAPDCAVLDVTQTTFMGDPIHSELTPIGEQRDDECPTCGRDCEPEESIWIGPEAPEFVALWESLPEA